MSINPQSPPGERVITPASLLRTSLFVYGAMAPIGLAIMAFGHRNLRAAFALQNSPEAVRLAIIGSAGALVLLALSYFFEDWFPSFRALKALVMRYLGPCSLPVALVLAIVPSIAEEIFFRGALQPFAGLFLTSLLFGFLHMGRDGLLSAWSLWALIAGLLIGWMYQSTGSLWPGLIAHFEVNMLAIMGLRRTYRTYEVWLKSREGGASVGTTKIPPNLPSTKAPEDDQP